MTSLASILDCAGTPRSAKLRRVVVRLASADVARIDALRARFDVSRAAIVRAFCIFGLISVEKQEGGTP